jgi:hypothetical protein
LSISRVQEGKQFFFEKKNQKTFVIVAGAAGEGAIAMCVGPSVFRDVL